MSWCSTMQVLLSSWLVVDVWATILGGGRRQPEIYYKIDGFSHRFVFSKGHTMIIGIAQIYQEPLIDTLTMQWLWFLVDQCQYYNLEAAPQVFWRRPPREITILIKSPIFGANPRIFLSMDHLLLYLSGKHVVISDWTHMDPNYRHLGKSDPPERRHAPSQKWQHGIVWPNHSSNCQKNPIEPQCRYISPGWKPRYRQFGVDRHNCRAFGIAVDKSRRCWTFWF